jgi:hypothetical protein
MEESSSGYGDRLSPAQAGTLLDIGIRDIFDSDHDMFRESARAFFENDCKPFHGEWEEKGEVPRELWKHAGDLGLLSNMVPEEYGGLGLDCKYPAIVWEEQSYSGCTGPGFAMHSDIVAPYITNYGTEEQKVSVWLRVRKAQLCNPTNPLAANTTTPQPNPCLPPHTHSLVFSPSSFPASGSVPSA